MNTNNSGSKTGLYIVLGVVVVLVLWFIVTNNSLVGAVTDVETDRANLEACYQERADLIPNLVATVQGAANHEEQIITTITEGRAALQKAIDSNDLQGMEEANETLKESINVLVEAYPEVTATQAFISLQDQLEGQENRIRVARKEYSKTVGVYNRKIKSFPTSIVANMKGYEPMEYFEATEGSENAPTVSF